jgi:hypothetical protein
MPSTIPKQRRRLPRSREFECPWCGWNHDERLSCTLDIALRGELIAVADRLDHFGQELRKGEYAEKLKNSLHALSLEFKGLAEKVRLFL